MNRVPDQAFSHDTLAEAAPDPTLARRRRRLSKSPNLSSALTDDARRGEPCLQPLAEAADQPASADVAQYGLFELADLLAVRCAANVDPEELHDAELRAHWMERVLDGETLNEPFVLGRRPYWVIDQDQRVGTIAFAVTTASPAPTIDISSVYIRPKHRRQGWGNRMLQTLKEAAFEVGFQRVTLQVEWNNQDALRFYCAQGMWVSRWKHAIELYFAKDQPRWHLEVHENEARFRVKGRIAVVANNQGHRLGWTFKKSVENSLKSPLQLTAPLQLALMRWPIIRTDKLWQDQIRTGWSEHGTFEGFALRLRQYERHIRRKGWNLPAERNPSFANLTSLAEVSAHIDRLDVRLSDGTRLAIPFEALGLLNDPADALQRVDIVDDEVVCRLQSGSPRAYNVDYLLFLTQSPEHLARAAELVREARSRAERA